MYDRIVVVTRRTRLDELVARFNTRGQAKFYIEHAGGGGAEEFQEYEREHEAYARALEQVDRATEVGLPKHVIDRDLVPTYVFGEHDIVVAVGQDGLVANVAKYTLARPLVGVNPDPERYDGVLLPFTPQTCVGAIQNLLGERALVQRVTLAEARLRDGQRLLAFNDLFVGARSHISARYTLTHRGPREAQSSSGVLVSTGAGSTGWISSVFNMAAGVTAFAGGTRGRAVQLEWPDERLLYAVREPFVSRHSTAVQIAGVIEPGETLRLESLMPTGGVIFSDGIEQDFLQFDAGTVASICASQDYATLVSTTPARQPHRP